MSRNPSGKVQLSFNSGEYSPFLDSRMDIDKAASAARQLENMQCTLAGEAKRRPGLKFVTQIEPAFLNSNYIELPFYHTIIYRSETTLGGGYINHYTTTFRGVVRLWESGTVQMIGEAKTNAPLGRNYVVWFGENGADLTGFNETVIALPGDDTFHDVDWSYSTPSGKYFHIECGAQDGNPQGTADRIILFSYPDGWNYPISFDAQHGVDHTRGTVDRSGTNIVMQGDWVNGGGIGTDHVVIYWTSLDTSTWILSGNTTLVNKTSIFDGLTGNWGPTNVAITDSSTVGVFVRHYVAQAGTNQIYASCDFGPLFRSTYDPVIQRGPDPL